jgi:hypothetical protein
MGSFDYQTLPFGAAFERSRHPDLMRHRVFQDYRRFGVGCYFFFLPSSLSPHLDFCANILKIQEQPFNLLILHIWFIFFYDFFILNNL